MWVQRADFDVAGSLKAITNLTTPDEGIGYLDLHPSGQSILYATQRANGDVDTYLLNLTADGSAQPVEFLTEVSALTAPCKSNPDPCTDASTFHATWSVAGDKVFFAYRVWDSDGNGIGNQAIGVADADGSNMTPLTFTNTENAIAIIDECPSPVANNTDLVVFVRTPDQGATNYLAVVQLSTGNVTTLTQIPQIADASGCPNYVPTPDGLTVLYMGCYGDACGFGQEARSVTVQLPTRTAPRHTAGAGPHWAAWGTTPTAASRAGKARATVPADPASGFAYLGVTMQPGSAPSTWAAKEWFEVPLTNTSSTIDSYAVTQCDAIHGLAAPWVSSTITCQGANTTYSFFQQLFVGASTGVSSADSVDTFQACMTPRCSTMMATY